MRRPWLLATCAISAAALAPVAHAQLVAGATQTSAGGQAPVIAQAPHTTDITLGAPRTIISWSSFNLAADQAVFYRFQDRGGIVLNKVSGGATIDGQVEALVGAERGAGNVWFSAPGGVIFGPNARVTVGGLLATPAVIADAAFLDPANHGFSFTGGAAGGVQVRSGAQLKAVGGALALIAGSVSSQAGATVTGSGAASVLYAAAGDFTVRFAPQAGDLDLLDFTVPAGGGSLSATPLDLQGQTVAPDVFLAVVSRASVASAVINAPGLIAAQSASADHGDIVLAAGVDIINGQPGGVRTNATTETTANFGAVLAQRDLLGGFGQPTAVTAAQLNAGRDLALTAASLQAGPVNVGRLLVLDASRGLTLTGGAFAGSAATLRTTGALSVGAGSIGAGGRLQLDVGTLQAGRLNSGRSLVVNASGAGVNGAAAVNVTSVLAEDDILITSANAAGSIVLGSASITGARADEAPAGRNLSLIARGAQADVTYGAVAGSPLLGPATVTVAAGRDATLNVDGLLTLKSGSAGRNFVIRANDLDLSGALTTANLRVESRLGGLAMGGGGAQSAPGDAALPRAAAPGMRITDAEFQFIQVSDQAAFYASPPGGSARGDLTIEDLTVNPSRVPRLLLSAGGDNDVLVTGVLAPSINGGVLSIGESGGDSAFRPGRILVTGSIGTSTGTLDTGYTGVRAFDEVNLFATRDVILGTPRFVELIAATAPDAIDIGRDAPAGSAPTAAERNRVFLTAGVLSATASQRIVQQNTGTTGRPNGLYLISGGGTLLQVSPAQVIDVSGLYRDRNGVLHPNLLGVTRIMGGSGGGEVRFNGCDADCSDLATTTAQKSFQVTEDSVVSPADAAVEGVPPPPPVLVFAAPSLDAEDIVTDPVPLSTGSDEIWRRRRAREPAVSPRAAPAR